VNYREEVIRAANPEMDQDSMLLNGVMGLSGEAGEVIEHVKKKLFHGKDLDKHALIKELGDVRWYLELISISLGVSMAEVERLNVEKLRLRYPNGFEVKR
jgi:NTP pyrophosphatase (non-canonical NTP hydrolase)